MTNKKISIEQFLRNNNGLFSKAYIERELGLADRTLQRVIDGRNVPVKHRIKIITFFRELGNNIIME